MAYYKLSSSSSSSSSSDHRDAISFSAFFLPLSTKLFPCGGQWKIPGCTADIIDKVDGRNGHRAVARRTATDESGNAGRDWWTNDAESQINIVDCLLNALREAVMFHSVTYRPKHSKLTLFDDNENWNYTFFSWNETWTTSFVNIKIFKVLLYVKNYYVTLYKFKKISCTKA